MYVANNFILIFLFYPFIWNFTDPVFAVNVTKAMFVGFPAPIEVNKAVDSTLNYLKFILLNNLEKLYMFCIPGHRKCIK